MPACQFPELTLSERYLIITYPMPLNKAKRHVRVQRNQIGSQIKIERPYMTDEEVIHYLEVYGSRGYEKLPSWLKTELSLRNLTWKPREPTDLEKWETVSDAREHRILNNELTIKDYQDKYIHDKPLTIT